jgi:AraC-like DNA-binding protein
MKTTRKITFIKQALAAVIMLFAPLCLRAGDLAGPVQVRTLDARTSLEGAWKMQIGDDSKYAAPEYDDRKWEEVRLSGSLMGLINKKTGGEKGVVWLRKTVYFNPDLPRHDVGLILGRIGQADETYFNGEKIGGMGGFPPNEHSMWNHPRHYKISKTLIRYGQLNVIAVRLSYHIYGEILGTLAITNIDDWDTNKTLMNILLIIIPYIVIVMGFQLFLIFFLFYIRRRESQEYLFYFLQLLCGLVILVDQCTYWNIYGNTLNRFRILGWAWVALNVVHPIFLHRIYDLKRKKTEIFLLFALVAVSFVDIFFTDERWLHLHGLLLIGATTQIGWYNLSCHISALVKKRPYAKLFSFFGIAVVLGAIHDGFVYFIKFMYLDADILGKGFEYMLFHVAVFPLYMGTTLVLVSRFVLMMNEVEDLNTSLETFIIENALLNEKLKDTGETKRKGSYPVINGKGEEKIQQVVDYINKNYTFDLSREGLAATVDVHPDNLGKLFKIYTNKKMGDYINELRVKEAARRLAQTDENIIDIAFSVGFDSLRTFNRVFPKFLKVTPEKYRKIIRNV